MTDNRNFEVIFDTKTGGRVYFRTKNPYFMVLCKSYNHHCESPTHPFVISFNPPGEGGVGNKIISGCPFGNITCQLAVSYGMVGSAQQYRPLLMLTLRYRDTQTGLQ